MSLIESRGDTDRDLALIAVMCAGCAALLTAMAVLMASATAATSLLGGTTQLPGLQEWALRVWEIITHPADPGAALPQPWSLVAGHAALFWVLAATIGLVAATTLGTATVAGWRRFGPTPPGHASRAAIRAELSVDAARALATRTRPTLSQAQRRAAAPGEVGAPCHRGPTGPLCVPFENPTGTLAPTQSGKSRRDLAHKAIDAPGALLCSTTKPDLLELAGLARTRRAMAGPVEVFDATGSVAWPAKVRWSPIDGCEVPVVAYRRSSTMVEASAVGLRGVGGNDKVFRDRATMVFGGYLLAAAIAGLGVDSLLNWTLTRDDEPAEILQGPHPERAANLRQEARMVPETSDAVWMSVRRVVEPLLEDTLRELCTPAPGEGFDARSFIANQGSLFLIAGAQQAGPATPLLTALAEHWIETAREMALGCPTRRLDPPATAVLDELANATPIPGLPASVADSAGRGMSIHWAAQSLAQLDDTFGVNQARLLVDTTTLISVWGGLKDAKTLEWASTLCGHHDRRRYQTHSDGMFTPGRSSLGTETVPVYRPGEIRTIPRNQVVVIHRTLGPIRARTDDVSARRDWPQIRADVEAIRDGIAEVNSLGYTTDPRHLPTPTVATSAAGGVTWR